MCEGKNANNNIWYRVDAREFLPHTTIYSWTMSEKFYNLEQLTTYKRNQGVCPSDFGMLLLKNIKHALEYLNEYECSNLYMVSIKSNDDIIFMGDEVGDRKYKIVQLRQNPNDPSKTEWREFLEGIPFSNECLVKEAVVEDVMKGTNSKGEVIWLSNSRTLRFL